MSNKLLIILPIINFIITYCLIGKRLNIGVYDGIGYAVTLSLLEILIFKKWLWKLKIVKKITGIENIQGEWKGIIHSSYDDSDHKIEKVIIKQSYNKYKIVLETKESKSYSEINKIIINEFDRNEIQYLYRNEAPVVLRKKNPMHFGVAKLELVNNELVGNYWTDREIDDGKNTRGTIKFTEQNKKGSYDLISILDIFDLF